MTSFTRSELLDMRTSLQNINSFMQSKKFANLFKFTDPLILDSSMKSNQLNARVAESETQDIWNPPRDIQGLSAFKDAVKTDLKVLATVCFVS